MRNKLTPWFVLLLWVAAHAADLPANNASVASAPLPILTTADLHKFTLVSQKDASTTRWAYAIITEVRATTVILQTWETNDDDNWKPPTEVALDQFIPADQQFIHNWTAQHPSGLTAAAPGTAEAGATGIACFFPNYSYRVDTSGALKGKTITAIAASGDHFLALCADDTLAAWGRNDYGQLGNGHSGIDALSLVPVLVDTTGALKGKTITSIGAYQNGSYALCADGSLYTWGQLPLCFLLKPPASKLPHAEPTLFDPAALTGKQVLAVSVGSSGSAILVLCSDGALFKWEPVKAGSPGPPTVAVRMDNKGALQGKKIVFIGDGGNKALAADGTIAEMEFLLVRKGFSIGMNDDPVRMPDQSGLLKGKTIVAFPEGNRVLSSDGTVAEWGQPSSKDSTGHVTFTLQRLILPVPAGKKIVAIAGGLSLYADGTLGLGLPRMGQFAWLNSKAAGFVDALQGKTILAITPNMVLFKEPPAQK